MAVDDAVMVTTKVFVFGAEPLCQAGMTAYLRDCPEIELVPETRVADAEVALVVADAVNDATLRMLRALQRNGHARVVLLVARVDAAGVTEAVQAGAVGILRRSAATRDGLRNAIRTAAADEGVLAPDLLGGLLRQVKQVQSEVLAPRGLTFSGLADREIAVLRLLSDGWDTRSIARRLAYSERTVKTIIQDVTRRFGARNRCHAVAFALRKGLI